MHPQADQFKLDLHHDLDRLFRQIGMFAQWQRHVLAHGHRVIKRSALEEDANRLAIIRQLLRSHLADALAEA